MDESSETRQEEVTTVDKQTPPQQVVQKTVRQAEPQAPGETPQRVYAKKKTLVRFNQIIWYIVSLVEVLLLFRIILKALGANPASGFASFIYTITTPFTAPFNGIFGVSVTGNSVFEWSTIIAGVVYACVAWGSVYLLDIMYPITPRDVERHSLA